LKALRHGSHSFTCKLHQACLYVVSVHQMALPLTCDNVRLTAACYSSIRKDERLFWPNWLTYSGRFTQVSGHPSAVGRAQNRESSLVKERRSTTAPPNQSRSPQSRIRLCRQCLPGLTGDKCECELRRIYRSECFRLVQDCR